jgi:hypothetical protein
MPDPTPPAEAYEAAARAEATAHCYDRTLGPDDFEQYVAHRLKDGRGLHAVVNAVWTLAFAAGQAEAASLRITHAPPRVSSIGWFRYEVLTDWEWAGEPWASGLYSYRHVVWGRRRAERLARQRP